MNERDVIVEKQTSIMPATAILIIRCLNVDCRKSLHVFTKYITMVFTVQAAINKTT